MAVGEEGEGFAMAMEATAGFLSDDANFSEKFKVLCISRLSSTLDLKHVCLPRGWETTLDLGGVLVIMGFGGAESFYQSLSVCILPSNIVTLHLDALFCCSWPMACLWSNS